MVLKLGGLKALTKEIFILSSVTCKDDVICKNYVIFPRTLAILKLKMAQK